MRTGWVGVLCAVALLPPGAAGGEEYRGRFTPDAEYVLSGQLRRDHEPLPEMPYRYVTDEEGYDASALSPVPPIGVHPRVLMSPCDIEAIRAKVAQGDKGDRWFRIIWNDIKSAKPFQHHHGLTSPALVALVGQDQKLGRELAKLLVEKALYIEPAAELMNSDPQMKPIRDNWYYYARMTVKRVGGVFYDDAYKAGGAENVKRLAEKGVEFSSDQDKQSAGTFFNTELRAYDYIHPFMTEEERAIVRRVITTLTAGKYATGMELPGNLFINNHMSMGEDLLITHLAIEGEEGYDPRILKEYAPAVRNKLTYDISLAGHMHEKCKGFLPERAVVAISRRAGDPETGALPLLRHDHLRAMVRAKVMDSANVYYALYPPPLGELDENKRVWWMGYGSGPWMDQFLSWAFLLRHVYPKDPVVDYFYKERMTLHGYGPARSEPGASLPKPRIRYHWRDLLALMATNGMRDNSGKVIDYDKDGLPAEVLARTEAYVDLPRGVAMSRSSWDKDALFFHYECRSDVYSAGHETPEAGDFNLVSHGVPWSVRRDWYMDAYFRNTVLIDGYAGVYHPVCADLMAVEDTEISTTFVSELTDQYNWRKQEKLFYSWHNLYAENPWEGKRWVGGRWGRGWEVPFHDHMRELHEGYTGLDWGNWHGETRGPEMYERWNDVDHVFRTVHMTKGETPYVLIVDDVRKDNAQHQYDWVMALGRDVTLFEGLSSVQNRYLEAGMPADRTTDLVLCLRDAPERRYDRYGIQCHREPTKGDPLLLVRCLWRNSTFAYPQPVFEQGWGAPRIKIPATAVDPEFRVLLFPYRHGEPKPVTWWNDDRSQLTIEIGGRQDVYTFGTTDRDRTVLAMTRDGEPVARTPAGPPKPALDTPHGWTPGRNLPNAPRTLLLAHDDTVAFAPAPLGMETRYTLDGSEPTSASTLYATPIKVTGSCTLKARTSARHWPFAENSGSAICEVRVVKRRLAVSDSRLATRDALLPGLACDVYEIHQTIFDKKTGIFTGKTPMLPDLDRHKPIYSARVPAFVVPAVPPQSPASEMDMGFYRYRGCITVERDGVYGFRINCCGPVLLRVGGQEALAVRGVYGLSQKDRFGQAALAAGAHEIELQLCDPVFWKNGREGPYAIEVAMLVPGAGDYQPIPPSSLSTTRRDLAMMAQPKAPSGKAEKVAGSVVPGLVMRCFDRSASNRELTVSGLSLEHMSVAETDVAYSSEPVLAFEGSGNAARLVEYSGWMQVDEEGEYAFELDREGANLLLIDGITVCANRVRGAEASGTIKLQPGLHRFAWRMAHSRAVCRVRTPGGRSFRPVAIGMFVRPADAVAKDDGRLLAVADGENIEGDMLYRDGTGTSMTLYKGTIVESGKSGKGIRLTGGDSRIIVEGLATPEDAFSLSFWHRTEKSTDTSLIGSSWGSHPEARLRHTSLWARYFRGSDLAVFDMRPLEGGIQAWRHVVLAYGPQDVKIYVDGVFRARGVKTVPERNAYVRDLDLFKGMDCVLDEVRLFNKALSDDYVKALYDKASKPKTGEQE